MRKAQLKMEPLMEQALTPLQANEKALYAKAWACSKCVAKVARWVGVSYPTAVRKLARYGLRTKTQPK